jgi:hypothetical protein
MTFWTVVALLALWITFRTFSPAAGAQRIREAKKKIYQTVAEPKIVQADSYSHLDLDFYRATSAALQSRGFRVLGDIDPGQPIPMARPLFIRISASADGGVMASVYNYRARGLARLLTPTHRDVRTIDFESEFSDGTFVVTSNAYAARHLTPPPAISTAYLESDVALHALLSRHLERIAEHVEGRNCRAVQISSLEDALQSQDRLRQVKAGFELQRGHQVSREELLGIATDAVVPGTTQAAESIAAEMERQSSKK